MKTDEIMEKYLTEFKSPGNPDAVITELYNYITDSKEFLKEIAGRLKLMVKYKLLTVNDYKKYFSNVDKGLSDLSSIVHYGEMNLKDQREDK